MGDECNVLSHRMEDLESFAQKELKKGEKEFPNKRHVRESPSGEPGEEKLEILEVMHAENLPEKVTTVEPLSEEPEVAPFPYIKTKLRPDAPPFTPESVTPVGETSYREPEIEEKCFVNVDLRSQDDQLIPEPEDPIIQPLKEIKDPILKPFSLTSTPILKKQVPKLQVAVVEEEDAVISIPINEPPTREATAENLSSQSRNFSITFFLRNRTQIAVIIASLVICAIIIVYAVV